MAFRVTYEAIREIVGRMALDVKIARAIVRKSGIVPGAAGATGPRTLLSSVVDMNEVPLSYQWSFDFTGLTRVRFVSHPFGSGTFYVFYSHTLDGSYDPGDYALLEALDDDDNLVAVSASSAASSGDLRWRTLPQERRAPIRLALSSSSDSLVSEDLTWVGVALQVT